MAVSAAGRVWHGSQLQRLMTFEKFTVVILGLVQGICNVLILLTCLDPWDKPKDDVAIRG
ncbi:hypothetical protein FCH38_09550 [Agrobacterium tumefaciens]|nr:hypothetical protein [Agrobacterium tumefaciens]